MKNNFIKKHWLKISIILFTCFIIIPVIMNVFKISEGFVDPLIVEQDFDLSLNHIASQMNNNMHEIFNIDTDLSNNIYRKSDSIKDISNNFYDKTGNNLLNTILSQLSGLTSKIDDMNNKKDEDPEPIENIKCIADFGTNIGDDLCCGQSGVLTDTKYVCPANYSKCDNMKCGSKYGTCVKP